MTYDEVVQKEQENFNEAIANINDPISALLKTHLLIEQGLERIIRAKLTQPNQLLSKGKLTFKQKLLLVNAMGIVTDKSYESVKILNDIRNDCAHKLSTELDSIVVEKLGNTLRPWFTSIKKVNLEQPNLWLGHILPRLAGEFFAKVVVSEHT